MDNRIGQAPPVEAPQQRTRKSPRAAPRSKPDPPSPAAQAEATVDKAAPKARRRRERVNATTTTVYFYDRNKFERFDAICRSHPRCSMAKILNQCVDAFLAAYDEETAKRLPGDIREVVINTKVYL
jgi:hypothetical protein